MRKRSKAKRKQQALADQAFAFAAAACSAVGVAAVCGVADTAAGGGALHRMCASHARIRAGGGRTATHCPHQVNIMIIWRTYQMGQAPCPPLHLSLQFHQVAVAAIVTVIMRRQVLTPLEVCPSRQLCADLFGLSGRVSQAHVSTEQNQCVVGTQEAHSGHMEGAQCVHSGRTVGRNIFSCHMLVVMRPVCTLHTPTRCTGLVILFLFSNWLLPQRMPA